MTYSNPIMAVLSALQLEMWPTCCLYALLSQTEIILCTVEMICAFGTYCNKSHCLCQTTRPPQLGLFRCELVSPLCTLLVQLVNVIQSHVACTAYFGAYAP